MNTAAGTALSSGGHFYHPDPRTGIFLTITVSFIMISGGTDGLMHFVRPCLCILPILLLLLVGKLRISLSYLALFSAAFTAEQLLIPVTHGFWNFLLVAAVGLLTHIMPGLIMGYYVMSATEVGEFIAAMERMHVPNLIIIPFSIIFRFFPTVKEEAVSIGQAMKMRGIRYTGIFRNPAQILEYCLVPLMVSVVKIGEELTVAALTRGLGAPGQRTSICDIKFGWPDVLLALSAAAAWTAFLIEWIGGIL